MAETQPAYRVGDHIRMKDDLEDGAPSVIPAAEARIIAVLKPAELGKAASYEALVKTGSGPNVATIREEWILERISEEEWRSAG